MVWGEAAVVMAAPGDQKEIGPTAGKQVEPWNLILTPVPPIARGFSGLVIYLI
jgi:hypothetical protein